MKMELKIAGGNPVLIQLFAVGVYGFFAFSCRELPGLDRVGFEVIFPIFTSIMVSEWGRFRADAAFELIAAQSRSLFWWVVRRFAAMFMEAAVFALSAMMLAAALREEMPTVSDMFLLYLSPAFFLSTVGCLFGMCFSREHVATLFCGMFWLSALLSRGLLRLPGAEYVYPFPVFARGQDDGWIINKVVLCAVSLLLWCVIFLLCKKAKFHRKVTA